MSEVKCSTCKGDKTLTFEQGQRRIPCVTCSGSGIDWRKSYDAAQSQLAALREELADSEEELDTVIHHNIDLQQRLADAERRNSEMASALKFYADKDHYSIDDELNWDSCSGEPSNILWHESEPWFIEDGSIARAALNPKPEAASHEL